MHLYRVLRTAGVVSYTTPWEMKNKICIVLFKVILYKAITLKPYLIKILLLDKYSEIYLRKLFGYK